MCAKLRTPIMDSCIHVQRPLLTSSYTPQAAHPLTLCADPVPVPCIP